MTAHCERIRELAPELALAVLDGEERAEALDHLAHCAECRRYLDELSATADELLVLAPAAEPPLGFEARVLENLLPTEGRRAEGRRAEGHRRRRWRGPQWRGAVAAVALAAAAAAAVWVATGSDREVADRYQETLAVADGRYFVAVPLEATGGSRVGTVFGYAGETSWCMVVVRPHDEAELRSGSYQVEMVRADGRRVPWRSLSVREGAGSVGGAVELDYRDLDEVRLVEDGDSDVAGAVLHGGQ